MKSPSKKQLELLEADDVVFDEMNLVELPFALLTDGKEAHESPVAEVPLAPNGTEALIASGKGSVPTALAERVVLGLLWLTQQDSGFREPVVRFPLRSLIEKYMHPDRFNDARANGALLKRVEEELNRVAGTRIVSDRWYDKELKKQTRMNAAIIDYVQVVNEGGRNSPRVLEVRWGAQIFKSIKARYTKSLDVRTVLSIERPLDLRFYRWLDRQLATKSRETVHSCQNFAKYKLLMRGQKIDRGGRTASGYVVSKLRESLERLNSVGFAVRMTVDEAPNDYKLLFEKISALHNEAIKVDEPGELVRLFQQVAHGLPDDAKPRRLAEVDREEAERWIEDYSAEQAGWMVRRAVLLHKSSTHKDKTLFRFKALNFYEQKALADYERQKPKQRELIAEVPDADYAKYRAEQLDEAREAFSDDELAALTQEVRDDVLASFGDGAVRPSEKTIKSLVASALEERLLHEMGAKSEEQFRSETV